MQSVQGHVREKPSLLFQIVDLLLLKMPEIYLRFLDGVCIDNVAFQLPFNKFVAKVTSEWQQDVINVSYSVNEQFVFTSTYLCVSYTGSRFVHRKYCISGYPLSPSSRHRRH